MSPWDLLATAFSLCSSVTSSTTSCGVLDEDMLSCNQGNELLALCQLEQGDVEQGE